MQITLPAPLEAKLTESRAVLHFAIGLYTAGEATLGQAATIAGTTQLGFMQELGRRRISMNYALEDFEDDLKTVRSLNRIPGSGS